MLELRLCMSLVTYKYVVGYEKRDLIAQDVVFSIGAQIVA